MSSAFSTTSAQKETVPTGTNTTALVLEVVLPILVLLLLAGIVIAVLIFWRRNKRGGHPLVHMEARSSYTTQPSIDRLDRAVKQIQDVQIVKKIGKGGISYLS